MAWAYGSNVNIHVKEQSRVILYPGKRIGQKGIVCGACVMYLEEEITQATKDYRRCKLEYIKLFWIT